MASSSSSRRRGTVARIARNVNPTGRISGEDIREKRLRKIKTVVSHRYLKLVRVFYSNLKMSDETFCSTVHLKEVWIGIVIFQLIRKKGFLFQKWIGLKKTEEDEWARWYAVTIDCMSESLKRFLGLR
ncbi:hypothetical protein V8G54_034591 [Vigna mungo]|uniref:Uncharacterized protein n=1 Tax=Vigna mungo TaxID=3915 RepID=A0AAQ3RK55_VIGMU